MKIFLKKKDTAIVFLVLMCVQLIPIEGYGVSNVKFAAMCVSPFIWINSFKTLSKAFIWGGIYLLAVLFSVIYNSDSFRLSTVGYKTAFVIMFIMYYDLIYSNRALTLNYYIKVLRTLILAYTICLVAQQLAIIVGVHSLPIINLMYYLNRGIGSNSLALEPSHAARILTVLMLVLMRMYKAKFGSSKLKLSELYKENKWVILGFLWSMLTMGSGTAFVGLAFLSLYFIKKQTALIISLVFLVFYFSIPYIDFKPFNRAKVVFEASLTLDKETVMDADDSAASRILPMINTIIELDFTEKETWFGKGIDANIIETTNSKDQIIGDISDYGLICYIISLIFVFVCCVNRIWSLETLIIIFLLGAGIGNIAYNWGILMLFTTSKYFSSIIRINSQQIKKS
mgnify:CR=1 FL=1